MCDNNGDSSWRMSGLYNWATLSTGLISRDQNSKVFQSFKEENGFDSDLLLLAMYEAYFCTSVPYNFTLAIVSSTEKAARELKRIDDTCVLHAADKYGLSPKICAIRRRDLALVCKDWRDALYSTHGPWIRIVVYIDRNLDLDLEPIRLCLANSGGSLIEIAMEMTWVHQRDVADEHEFSQRIQSFLRIYFDLFDSHFGRVRDLKIICSDRTASQVAMACLVQRECTSLENISLVLNLTDESTALFPPLRYIYCANSLPYCAFLTAHPTVSELHLVAMMFESNVSWTSLRRTLTAFCNVERMKLRDAQCDEILTARPGSNHPPISIQSRAGLFNSRCCRRGCYFDYTLLASSTSHFLVGAIGNYPDDLGMDIIGACTSLEMLDVSRFKGCARDSVMRILRNPDLELPKLRFIAVGWMMVDHEVREVLASGKYSQSVLKEHRLKTEFKLLNQNTKKWPALLNRDNKSIIPSRIEGEGGNKKAAQRVQGLVQPCARSGPKAQRRSKMGDGVVPECGGDSSYNGKGTKNAFEDQPQYWVLGWCWVNGSGLPRAESWPTCFYSRRLHARHTPSNNPFTDSDAGLIPHLE
ncbi:hypothetical protein DFH06DRAFT_1370973 [Mycena polygramma]|nr:hypothetical protein DFH06DRAFT_1370973 [Mycena polygramma]